MKKCSICGKDIQAGREFEFFNGRMNYVCPSCHKIGNCEANIHEVAYWSVRHYTPRKEKKD